MSLGTRQGWLSIFAGRLFAMTTYAHEISAPETAARMYQAAETFLNSLSTQQHKTACFSFMVSPLEPVGIPAAEFDGFQMELQTKLIDGYVLFLCVGVCPIEDCITMKPLNEGIDPRTGQEGIPEHADWRTHPNNPLKEQNG